MALTLSASKVKEFASCPKKYAYRMRFRDLSFPPTPAMALGTEIHLGIENYYRGKPTPYSSNVEVDDIVRFYVEHVAAKEQDINIIGVEVPVEQTIGPYLFHCRFDMVYEKDGIICVRDFKTKDVIPKDYTWFDLDWQMKVYAVMINQAYSQYPAIKYEQALIRRCVPPGYGSRSLYVVRDGVETNKKSNASTDPLSYVRVLSSYRTPKTIYAIRRELKDLILQMQKVDYRSPSMFCSTCPFLELCVRESSGEHVNDAAASMLLQLAGGRGDGP